MIFHQEALANNQWHLLATQHSKIPISELHSQYWPADYAPNGAALQNGVGFGFK